jgi:hypothetical protein
MGMIKGKGAAAALLLACATAVAPGAALGAGRVPLTGVGTPMSVGDAESAEGHGAALVVYGTQGARVLHQDLRGHWRSFSVPGRPQRIRTALTGLGSGLAAWDAGDRVVVRAWNAAGTATPQQAVLTGVQTRWSSTGAAVSGAEWQLASDGRGTVAIASAGTGGLRGGVYAAVRDGHKGFTPQQQLRAPDPAAVRDDLDLHVSPIGGDGAITVQWGPHGSRGPGVVTPAPDTGQAVRVARAAAFGPAMTPAIEEPLFTLWPAHAASAQTLVFQADQSATVLLGPAVQKLCARAGRGCSPPVRLARTGTVEAVVFTAYRSASCRCAGQWYVATAQGGGAYDAPVPATADPRAVPLWSKTRGTVAIATATRTGMVVKAVQIGKLGGVEGK